MFTRDSRVLRCVALLGFVLTLVISAGAQTVNDAYSVGYFERFRGLLFVNTGQIGSPIDAASSFGNVCADIYIFDANQEMLACCSCPTTANELSFLTEATILTGVPVPRGVFKVVADAGCDETSIPAPVPAGLRVWGRNLQVGGVTEFVYPTAPLTATERQFLGQACAFVHYLGSGKGICACKQETQDAQLIRGE